MFSLSSGSDSPPNSENFDDLYRWKDHYEDRLRSKLLWATSYVKENYHRPDVLKKHFKSLLALLSQAHARSELHLLAMEVIVALHPWPLRWGYWEAWAPEIDAAVNIFAQANQPHRQAEYLAYQTSYLHQKNDLQAARRSGEQAVALALQARNFKAISLAGSAYIAALISMGLTGEASTTLLELKKLLDLCGSTASPGELADAQARLGMQHVFLARRQDSIDQALEIANQIIDQLDRLPATDPHLLAETLLTRSTMLWVAGDYSLAIVDLQRVIQFYANEGDVFAEATCTWKFGPSVLEYGTVRFG